MRHATPALLLLCALLAAAKAGSLLGSLKQTTASAHAQDFFPSDRVFYERKVWIYSVGQGRYLVTHPGKGAYDSIEYGNDPDAVRDWTICFLHNERMNNNFAIRSSITNRYIQALPGSENSRLQFGLFEIKGWENFQIIINDDGTYSFKTYHGTYWRAKIPDGDCNDSKCHGILDLQTKIGPWEKFRIEYK